jgi:transcriptional regulator with XRE-family HTH domain
MGSRRDRPRRLAEKLLTIRKTLGLSQSEVAKELGLPMTAARISEWEKERRVPDLIAVLRYARLAQVRMVVLADDRMELIIPERKKKAARI